jgi:transposase InsO family protein
VVEFAIEQPAYGQVRALEKAKQEKEAHGEIETEHPGYLGSQDAYYVGNLKGVGRIYLQTFIDIYSKLAFAKLCDRKQAITAADMLNDRALPFFGEHAVPLLGVLTDRGSGYCGNRETHEYALYLDLENIEHTRTRSRGPQTNGICERFHQTIQNELYASAFRRKLYHSLEKLQRDVDVWMESGSAERSRTGKYCYDKTRLQTFIDSAKLAYDRDLARIQPTSEPATTVM